MQIEITLTVATDGDYVPSDLGFLLHKHPAHLHERETNAGTAFVFFREVSETAATAVLFLDVDPVALVRGRGGNADGPLAQYVNDRAYAANSFLSVALGRSFAQTMAGKSRERQGLADRALPLATIVTPVAVAGGADVVRSIFEPLGYSVEIGTLDASSDRDLVSLRIAGTVRIADLLNHLHVLIPVLDNTKHYWIDESEIETLLAKGEGWLADHPARDMITRRALMHRRRLVDTALDRLAENGPGVDDDARQQGDVGESALERPIRLHDLRLETVAETLYQQGVTSVLDLGCGEGRLLRRLIKQRGLTRLVGVDPSVTALERAARRLHLDEAADDRRERVSLQMGSVTYADRRWSGFDAATLVEVIEHVDPPRLSSLAQSVFGVACPGMVVITTPNREYNVLFEGMQPGAMRHADHRFEWSRSQFADWCEAVAAEHGYHVDYAPIGPVDETHGAPSQMAVFRRVAEGE